jgi:flagellar assembly protein FliH
MSVTTQSVIIKAGAAQQAARLTLKPFHFGELADEATALLASARGEADRIIAEARVEAENIRTVARDEGHAEGHAAGYAEGVAQGKSEALAEARETFNEQQKNLVASFERVIRSVDDERATWRASARQDLVDLAVAIARRVAHVVGERDRQVVLGNLDQAIEIVGNRSEVSLLVSPRDEEAARSFARSLTEMHDQWQEVRVKLDPEIAPGGCRVQWGTGAVDARLATQLDRIAAELGVRDDGAVSGSENESDFSDEKNDADGSEPA